jgi:tRNA pseudouridine38-40 synthase
MKEGAGYLAGRHDFTSFRTKDDRDDSAVRTIKRIKIERKKEIIYIDIEADGFLYNMVRNIVGTLIDVGRGKLTPVDVRHILNKKDKRACGPTAAAKGLSLVKVRY